MIEVTAVQRTARGTPHTVHIYTNGCAVSTGFVDLHIDDAQLVLQLLADLLGYTITPRGFTRR